MRAEEGAEDCLYLNVHVPPKRADGNIPTIVWLHGGGFINGSGNAFNGAFLARTTGAIVVTVNYRLGPFGWLALPSLSAEGRNGASGNYGLLDSIAALTWVKRNISRFGGDPNRVTISGQSAGGEQVFALMASPYARNLFQRAISMSAPAAVQLPTVRDAAKSRAAFLRDVGCASEDGQPACLRRVSARTMLSAAKESWNLMNRGIEWTPTVDGEVLPKQWLDMFRDGRLNAVPTIVGATRAETNLMLAIMENGLGRSLSSRDMDGTMARMGPVIHLVNRMYPRSAFPSERDRVSQILTDSAFAAGEQRNRAALSRHAPVYGYEFCDEHAADSHVVPLFGRIGCGHDSDIAYVFRWDDFTQREAEFSPEQRSLAEAVGRYWGNFAASGDPNGPGLPRWEKQGSGSDVVLLLRPASGGGIAMTAPGAFTKEHRLTFWNSLNFVAEHRGMLAVILLLFFGGVVAALCRWLFAKIRPFGGGRGRRQAQ